MMIPLAKRIIYYIFTGMVISVLSISIAENNSAQCVDHPLGKTALKFGNQTRYELTFFIDLEEIGIAVPSKKLSADREVDPGEHLLRAMARIENQTLWVWAMNDVPAGQICTWTIDDPKSGMATRKAQLPEWLNPKNNQINQWMEKEKYNVSK